FKKARNELNDEYTLLKTILLIFGSVSVIGFIVGYITLLQRAQKIAEKKIEAKLEDFFNDKKERFKELVNQQLDEIKIKRESSILVFSKDKTEENFLKSFLKEMDFKKVSFTTDYESAVFSDLDLILINDESDSFEQQYLNDLPENIHDSSILFFYFGTKRLTIDKNHLSVANFRSQLYGNLINGLKYQSYLDI
ncbi:unnamed protein product, partial [Chrysoparadoxa australica]